MNDDKMDEEPKSAEKQWREDLSVVCNLLACRLKELAGFLDSLLRHEGVVGALAKDQHEEMRKAIDMSLDFSRNISLTSLGMMNAHPIQSYEHIFSCKTLCAFRSNIFLRKYDKRYAFNFTIYIKR